MSTDALFQPFQMRDLTLPNRIVLAPLTRNRAGAERIPNAVMAEYYVQRSSAGLLISEATTISSEANGWVDSPGIYTDAMEAAWRRVVDAVHAAGGKFFLQLWHMGRSSHSSFHNGALPVAPSPIAIQGDEIHTPIGKKPFEVPRALETSEMPRVVEDYRLAAERAKRAGFDGVEIHSANGYLLDQFLQSKTNHRTDGYGGSIENRYRLLGEVTTAVVSVFGANRVGVRLAPNGIYNDMGSTDYREQFTYVARKLNELDLAYLHVFDRPVFGFHDHGEPMTLAEFRKLFDGPIMGNGGYTGETAAAAIAAGEADLIAFGRPYIGNPDLVERIRNGWPLADAPMETWYARTGAAGYADFPAYQGA